MKVLIIGGGTVGVLLIEKLRRKAKITVVEKDRLRCEKLAEKYEDIEVVNSKAEDTDALNELNIHEFDIAFVVTGNQSVNIVSSLYLKHLGAQKIISKLSTPNYIEMLENMKIETVCEDVVTADEFIRKAFSPELSKLLASNIKLENIKNEFVGLSVKDVVERGFYPVVLLRENSVYIPSIDEVIREDDELFLLKQE